MAVPETLHGPLIREVHAQAFTIPTDLPEADGSFDWHATTLVVAHITAGDHTGIGYTYADASIVPLIQKTLAASLLSQNSWDIPARWFDMQRSVRNLGRAGLAATAISALDCALWDAKSKCLGLPLVSLLGALREQVPIYGSGGFTSYTDSQLSGQLHRWVAHDGCRWVKMKIGRQPERDPQRVQVARAAIGERGLFVDANGALAVKQALHYAGRFAEAGVEWFEEPVPSDDLRGLHGLRSAVGDGMEIAAGEYGYTLDDFRLMLEANAVDVMQADASRCGGITGFLRVAALCDAFHIPLSAHCAPALHLHAACAAPGLRHQEWFHDHVRIESMLFDGAPHARDGSIRPDMSRPGCGLTLKTADAQRYAVS
ncbi:MAG: enolase C-terminal domain-like protein [Janthinobacterium lividum]